jgi:2-methylisocitrate lyase-like PEP mutase family enzyme
LIGTPSAAQAATLTNTGFSALAISSIAIAGAGAADFGQSGTCAARG